MPLSQRELAQPPSKLFMAYVARLIFRAGLFAYLVYLFVAHPERLTITEYFGFDHGLSAVDVLFMALLIDMVTKFLPKANVSMGSLKQFADYHVPTFAVFRGGREGFQKFVLDSLASGKEALALAKERGLTTLHEVADHTMDTLRALMRDVTFLRGLTYAEEDLTAGELLRNEIRADRAREIIPVIVFWFAFNGLIALALSHFGLMSQKVRVLWCGFYFLFDMICVVLWCPIQLVLMHNRCCTTCQIFNWDGIMAVTPLIPLTFVTPFAFVLVLLAVIVLVRWEAAFARYPERFDERTNLSLRCASCRDKLCYLRAPLTRAAKAVVKK